MRRLFRNCNLIALALLSSMAIADEFDDPEPDFNPPVTGEPSAYDTAIDALEVAVDVHFHALLRAEAGASELQIEAFEDALQNKVTNEFRPGELNDLTTREQRIQIKMVALRQLNPEFAHDALPADLDVAFDEWESTRPAAIPALIDRDEL